MKMYLIRSGALLLAIILSVLIFALLGRLV